MVNILKNKKRVFLEALFLTLVIFILGVLIGILFESNKLNQLNDYYIKTESSISDAFMLNLINNLNTQNCDVLKKANLDFADEIYQEAKILEKYENTRKITESMEILHKKYDVLRTFLWFSTIKTSEKCGRKSSTVVYLYESQTEDLTKRATQNVWSKILYSLKEEKGDEIILIPIAVDKGIISLNSLISQYNITSYPVIIVNEKEIFYNLEDKERLEEFLK